MKQPRQKPKRETLHIFDRVIKYLLGGASSPNVVCLVNALFERRYPHDSLVRFGQTESVRKQGKSLELLRSDVILNIAGDDFAVEFQTHGDEVIGLRLFEYGFRHGLETKRMTNGGELIEVEVPDACVVVFENANADPRRVTFRLSNKTSGQTFDYDVRVFRMAEQSPESLERQRLLLLLPFCLLRFRRELVKGATAEERCAIAGREMRMIDELEDILTRSRKAGFLGTDDGIIILESMAQMHEELYGAYPEFQEASMELDNRLKLRWVPYK